MAQYEFTIKQNDRLPVLEAFLQNPDGTAVNLAGTGTVCKFGMRLPGLVSKVDAAAVITDGLNGKVQYQWTAGDTDTSGEFIGEFQVTFTDGRKQTFPNKGYIKIIVEAEVAT